MPVRFGRLFEHRKTEGSSSLFLKIRVRGPGPMREEGHNRVRPRHSAFWQKSFLLREGDDWLLQQRRKEVLKNVRLWSICWLHS